MTHPESGSARSLETDFVLDRSAPLEQRLDMARHLAMRVKDLVVPVAVLHTCEGNEISDEHLSDAELEKMFEDYGFTPGTYTGARRDARTQSTTHTDLTLQITEEPLDLGQPSELFPTGQSWNSYDHTIRVNLLVSPQNTV